MSWNIITALAVSDHNFDNIVFGENASKVGGSVMKLYMLNDTATSGAVCLDGTSAGFYFSPATDPTFANDWGIWFESGGWCYDKVDCWSRSLTPLGSSATWGDSANLNGLVNLSDRTPPSCSVDARRHLSHAPPLRCLFAIWRVSRKLSANCTVNPTFCRFNRVFMPYCDGNSFSGNRDLPVVVQGLWGKPKPLIFRGKRILNEVIKSHATHFGLSSAKRVLLTGCSAGGLATFLHADYVHETMRTIAPKTLQTFKAVPISGFFLEHSTVMGVPVYQTQMQSIFEVSPPLAPVEAAHMQLRDRLRPRLVSSLHTNGSTHEHGSYPMLRMSCRPPALPRNPRG